MASNKLISSILVVVTLGSVGWASYATYNQINRVTNRDQQISAIKKENQKIQDANDALLQGTFQARATQFLKDISNGDLNNAGKRYDKAHASDALIQGLASPLQGDDRNYYISEYNNQTSSGISHVKVSQFEGNFMMTFDYDFSGVSSSGNNVTRSVTYVVTGHQDGDHWQADKVVQTNAIN